MADEESEFKYKATRKDAEHVNIIFIGHVDSGKSTISGQVLVLTGMVDQRTIEKYEREAQQKNRAGWFLAYIMDINEEERAKGKTVEVGRAVFDTDHRRFTVMDAPGHKNYVPNMIAGAAQADVAVLVISARRGEFEAGFERGGQTREHAMLAITLGVRKLIVVINKMDEPTVNWSKERYDQIIKDLTPFLKQLQFAASDVTFIPISGLRGDNMLKRSEDPLAQWYSGPTLLSLMDVMPLPQRDATAPLRMPVLDTYKESGKEFILGKIEQGTMRVGQTVVVMPSKAEGHVSSISNDADEFDIVTPGENVKVTLTGSAASDQSTMAGSVLCAGDLCRATLVLEAQLHIIETLPTKSIIANGYGCVLHIHTASEEAEIAKLLTLVDPKTKEVKQKMPRYVKKNSLITCLIKTSRPIACDTFRNSKILGRFTLRDEGVTIAIGRISRLPPEGK